MDLYSLSHILIISPLYYSLIIYLSIMLLLALPTLTLFLLSQLFPATPSVSFFYRCLASYLALMLTTSLGALYSLFTYPLGLNRSAQHVAGYKFAQLVHLFCGVRFQVVDPPDKPEGQARRWLTQTRPCVIIANHQSELDVALCGEIFPNNCSITAKRSLKLTPFLGQFMALSGTIFIDRSNRQSAMKMFEGAAQEMHTHKQSVFIFPEGTRSYAKTPELMAFKKGAFHLAIKAQVPVVAVVAANYSGVLDVGRKVFRPGVIPVGVLEPVETKGMWPEDVDGLVEEVRGRMMREIVRISESEEGRKVAGKGK